VDDIAENISRQVFPVIAVPLDDLLQALRSTLEISVAYEKMHLVFAIIGIYPGVEEYPATTTDHPVFPLGVYLALAERMLEAQERELIVVHLARRELERCPHFVGKDPGPIVNGDTCP
jgi:hypothetical protein